MKNVLAHIIRNMEQNRSLLAVLIDPDKEGVYYRLLPYLKQVDLIFIGGSTGGNLELCIEHLRQHTQAPLVLFPGNVEQFTPKADALLFLSLLNADDVDWLITPHIKVAVDVFDSRIESIPMGYVLIDGNHKSSVEIVSHCKPIPQSQLDNIVSIALAGQLLGKQLIYLEAGSGALRPVSADLIRAVKERLTIPLIVGGGITTVDAMLRAVNAGADVVVVGNHFEQHPDELPFFIQTLTDIYGT